MLILLPPSEAKTGRPRGAALCLDRLHLPELNPTRAAVIDALATASASPNAARALGVSPNLGEEIARNLELRTAPAIPVSRLYTGVLYDALDLESLDARARRAATRWIVVQSALFGALRLTDKVPPYRLSMAVNLPGVGPLAAAWRTPLSRVMPTLAGSGVVVDARSSTYAAAWTPRDDVADRWVQIKVPGATHMAKHTRGLVTRHLAERGKSASDPQELAGIVAQGFAVELTPPARSGRAWTLHVQAP